MAPKRARNGPCGGFLQLRDTSGLEMQCQQCLKWQDEAKVYEGYCHDCWDAWGHYDYTSLAAWDAAHAAAQFDEPGSRCVCCLHRAGNLYCQHCEMRPLCGRCLPPEQHHCSYGADHKVVSDPPAEAGARIPPPKETGPRKKAKSQNAAVMPPREGRRMPPPAEAGPKKKAKTQAAKLKSWQPKGAQDADPPAEVASGSGGPSAEPAPETEVKGSGERLAVLLQFGTLVTMAEDTEPRNDVDPRPRACTPMQPSNMPLERDPRREEFAAYIAAGGELNVPPAPCMQGCGRPSARGYRNCCRTCIQTFGKTHEPQCEQAHKERREAMETLRSWGRRACAHCGDAMTPTVVQWDCLSCWIPRKGGGKGKDGCGSPFSPDEANTSSEEREEGLSSAIPPAKNLPLKDG